MFSTAILLAATRSATIAVAAFAAAGLAHAGFITIDERAIDAVYSQASFGLKPVDIRFGPSHVIQNTSLLDIDSDAEFDQLANQVLSGAPTVSVFFVDAINFCGEASPGIVGCGEFPGSVFILDSVYAAGSDGAATFAHELGHNLGLDHVLPDDGSNLMNPSGPSLNFLDVSQATTVLASPLIQIDGNGLRYIQVTPFAVVAAVPEPASAAFMLSGLALGWLGWRARREPGSAAKA